MVTLAMYLLWRIWKCRNDKFFNGNLIEPQHAVIMAVQDAEEFVQSKQEVLGTGREGTMLVS